MFESKKDKFEKDNAFKRLFYQSVDTYLLPIRSIEDLQRAIEYLIGLSEKIDGDEIFYPVKNWGQVEYNFNCLLYGIKSWSAIKATLTERGVARQVDLIAELKLEKETANTFFYYISMIGFLEKSKDGRFNVYRLPADEIAPDRVRQAFQALFDERIVFDK